jgi:hypothetical protein
MIPDLHLILTYELVRDQMTVAILKMIALQSHFPEARHAHSQAVIERQYHSDVKGKVAQARISKFVV